mmetsp:Transcript_38971/g.34655  ORF Transcript_38971/g.34655 Transcript_38971/m.34655 type:complete len:161 (-) Transcript_38971:2399-2881(-)
MIRKFFQANELPEGVGQPVYILPGSWFNRWKAYNNFQKLMGDASEDKDFMVDESGEKPLYPGAINPLELIDEAHINLIDPSPDHFYTNIQLKHGLNESQDFYIINQECWDFLYNIYGGIPLRRYTYRKSENDINVSVEVWLQKMNNILLPLPQKDQPGKL